MAKGSRLNRREFLRRSTAAAAGAVAFPYIIPASALGADGKVAPSNRITMGFIGVGKMGREAHVRGFSLHPEVQVLAVCDVESERRAQARKMVEDASDGKQSCDEYLDYQEMLARDDIDAVTIATPDHMHATASVATAKAGKDIYCEKPMTRFIKEGRAVVDAVRRYGRVFQTGSQQRSDYSSRFIRAAELTRSGAIGELKEVHVGVGGPPDDSYGLPPEPVPPTLDWDRWQGPAPWRPYNSTLCPLNYTGFPHWRYFRDYAGGSFSDFGAHHFDIAQWGMGMDHTGPVEIIPPDGKEHKQLVFLYANGIPCYHGAEADVVFVGTKGRILASRGFLRSEPESILETRLGPNDVHLNRHRNHKDDWLHCIRTREKPVADVEIGHRTSTVCQLGNIAFVLKRPLKWDPEKEEFIGDDEANRMLSRPGRGSWTLI